ncbi:MAG: SpoIIE family protein phosphatase [Bacteroidales bacterium]|nr:SpoIIE family protein phosphatase [Bacteroidales bacterium]
MKKGFHSFSGRLTRTVVITVLVTMTIISVFVFLVAASGILVFSRAHYSDSLEKANRDLALAMSKVEISADNIIDELCWHLATPELVLSTMEYELNVNRHIYGCGLGFVADFYPSVGRWYEPYALNDGNRITLKIIGSEAHDYFQSEWYNKGMASPEGAWSNPYLDDEGGETVLCTFSRPVIMEPEKEIAGVFGADLSINGLASLIQESIRKENEESIFYVPVQDDPGQRIYCFIIGPDGDYIAHPDPNRILKANFYDYADGKDADRYRKLGDAMRAGESGDLSVVVDGIRSDVYYAPLLHSGWSMGIVVPTERLLTPAIAYGAIIIFLILLGVLLVFLTCRRSIKKASKPLIQLAESAQEIATGKFDTPLPTLKYQDELRLLRDSFDYMQSSLARYVDELKETTAQNASIERELSVARSIQMSMLPTTWPPFPDRNDLDIYGSVAPAKAVGGDLFDFRIRDEKLYFCIGDVSGKGIPAALVMTVISSMFRTLSASEDSPRRIMSAINASISAQNENLMFVTLFVGTLDLSTGVLQYTNAGHNAPIVISAGEARLMPVDANIPVGIMADWSYSQQETTLSPGTILFLYTDGLTEATRSDGELFQEDRVLVQLSGHDANTAATHIVADMTQAVNRFIGDAEQSDDLTMLVLKMLRKNRD